MRLERMHKSAITKICFYLQLKMILKWKEGDRQWTEELTKDSIGNPWGMYIQTGPWLFTGKGLPLPWWYPGHYSIKFSDEPIYEFNVWGVIIDSEASDKYLAISTENGVDVIKNPLKVTYTITDFPDVNLSSVCMRVYKGNTEIREKCPNEFDVGEQSITWNGKDNSGQIVTPGEYALVIEVGGEGGKTESKKHGVTVFKVGITTPITTVMNISNVPEMPDVTFNAAIQPSSINIADVTFDWYLELTFNQNGRDDQHRIPESETVEITGRGDWAPEWGDLIAGGNVHVFVTASIGGAESENDQDGYEIRGTNPTQAQIFGTADDIEEKAVCWQESSHRQFNATKYSGIGWPLFGTPNGWGLMQPDPPRNERQIWHWSENLTWGVGYLHKVYGNAQVYLNTWHDPDTWDWDPSDPAYADRVWNDAFSRYNTGDPIYSPNGNGGVRNCSGDIYSNPDGCDYADAVRGHINNPPW